MEACRLTVRQAELISSLARSVRCVCGGARGCTRAPGIQGTGWGFHPAAHTPQPDTSDHISPWEPGGPGGSCKGGREGVQSMNVVFLAVVCVVCVKMFACDKSVCVCARNVPFLFEVCPPKREMRGSDLLFFWWDRCEESVDTQLLRERVCACTCARVWG